MGQSLTRRRFLAFSGAALAMSAGMRTGHVAAHESESGWQAAASLLTPREDHTATLLDDRRVLVVGGFEKRDDIRGKAPYVALSDVEWYDPLSDRWQAARNTLDRRGNHTATLLQDGRVLVVGGARERDNTLEAYDTAELYDPLRDRWSQASPLAAPRAFHTATLLDDGRVLVVGGGALGEPPLAGTEIYDSATNRWTAAGRLAVPRVAHTATLQPSGRVLVVGGTARGGSAIPDAEVYIPAENRWVTIAPMRGRRFGHTATLLADRRTLVVGGTEEGSVGNTLRTAEVLRTGSAGWVAAASLSGGAHEPYRPSHARWKCADRRGARRLPDVSAPHRTLRPHREPLPARRRVAARPRTPHRDAAR